MIADGAAHLRITLGRMKHSEFHAAMDEVFGMLGPSLTVDLVLEGMDGRTGQQALDAGVDPQKVWDAVCETTELPEEKRFPHRAEKRR